MLLIQICLNEDFGQYKITSLLCKLKLTRLNGTYLVNIVSI